MGPEAKIERRVAMIAERDLGVRSIKLNGPGVRGWPDRCFLIPRGRPLFIEFKAPGGTTSPRQDLMIGYLLKQGHDVEVHDNVEAALLAIRAAVKASTQPI